MSANAGPSSPDHDEFCQDLLYGFYAPDGRWVPPADGIANEFPWHAQYHLRAGKKGWTCSHPDAEGDEGPNPPGPVTRWRCRACGERFTSPKGSKPSPRG